MNPREELAAQLYYAHWRPTATLTARLVMAWQDQPKTNKEAWYCVADECLRQMEWARRKTITPGWTMELGDVPRKIVINQLDALTLAPDDWTPPKEGQ